MRGMGSGLAVIALAASAVLALPVTPGVAGELCGPRGVSIGDTAVSESAGLMNFTVFSNGCAGGTVQFQILPGAGAYLPATAGTDFVTGSGQIGWTPGEVGNKTINVLINNDAAFEPDEGLTVVLHSPTGVSIVDDSGLGVIVDNDAPHSSVYLSEPFCGMENCPSCWIRVELDHSVPVDVSLQLTTRDGTADSATDFVAVDTWITIPAGATQARIAVPILNDNKPEPTEYFFVSIAHPSVGHIDGGLVTVVINDDDDVPASAAPDNRLP